MLDTDPDRQALEADLDRSWIRQNDRSDRIRIRIHFAVSDPYWKYESGSRSMKIDQKLQINLVCCLSKRLLQHRRCFFLPGSVTALR
jgi:hypothetical protein